MSALGLALPLKPRAIGGVVTAWVLNADPVPVAGVLYLWKDDATWTDGNVWKD